MSDACCAGDPNPDDSSLWHRNSGNVSLILCPMQRHRVLTVTATHCVLMSERMRQMQQQISFVTLGIAELPRSRRFYVEGFGWSPVFENEEIIFYQMPGFVLGPFLSLRWETT